MRQDWKTALENYTIGLKIAEAVADEYPIDIATQKNRIAQLLSDRGEPGDAQQALAKYREALAIHDRPAAKLPRMPRCCRMLR